MFHLLRPGDERVRRALSAVAEAPFTHEHEGVTRETLEAAPPGFTLDRHGCVLGLGEGTFTAACAALRRFGNYPPAFTRVVLLEPDFGPGTVFGTVASHFGFASMNPCRVGYVIDDVPAGRFGFGLGTLPGHAASGEERFLVTLDRASGVVRYDVQAISRPAVWLARLGRPAMRRVQVRFQRESREAMRRLAGGEAACSAAGAAVE